MSAARQLKQSDLLSLFVVEALQSRDDLQAYLLGVLQSCNKWFRTSGSSIFLAAEEPGLYRLAAKFGPAARTPDGATLRAGEGLAGQAVQFGEPRLLVDADGVGPSKRHDIGSSMIVPLDGGAGCVGVLNLARAVEEPRFCEEDLEFAKAVAQQIALAVRNAQIFAESRHLNETMKAVFANLGSGLIAVGPEGVITHLNAEACSLLGAVGATGEAFQVFLTRCPEPFQGPLQAAMEDVQKGHRHRSRHEVGAHAFALTATPLPSRGFTLSLQDVTEIESAQKEFDRIKRLAEVGQMTATIAHEIRNPLTGIRSAAKMIRDTPELAEEFAEIVEVEAVKLSELCDEFLEFARPLRLETAEVNLGKLCDGVCSLLRPDFESAGVNLETVGQRGGTLRLDSRRIEQVVRNLLLNALQATPKGGTVSLEVGPGWFAVSDNGAGMDEATVGRLFSPFFTTKTKGTGLGLSAVRKILDAHGATIHIWSRLAEGSRFEVRFQEETAS